VPARDGLALGCEKAPGFAQARRATDSEILSGSPTKTRLQGEEKPNPVVASVAMQQAVAMKRVEKFFDENRVVRLFGDIDNDLANRLVGQMLEMERRNPEEPIKMYINSGGGSVMAGFAILDTMQSLKCPVHTVAMGMACSMAAFLLNTGAKGHRKALPHTSIMIHAGSTQVYGQATDIEIQVKHMLQLEDQCNAISSFFSGQSMEKLTEDQSRDFFMTAEEAVQYGWIDEVVPTKLDSLLETRKLPMTTYRVS